MMIADDAICFQPAELPRLFHYCTTGGTSPSCMVLNEVKGVIASDFHAPVQRCSAVGDVLGLVRKAQQGLLDSTKEAKAIVSAPPVWELRWSINRKLYRLYFSQRLDRKPEFIGLSFARKRIAATNVETNRLQNIDAKEAQRRFQEFEDRHWGHATQSKPCAYCNDRLRASDLWM